MGVDNGVVGVWGSLLLVDDEVHITDVCGSRLRAAGFEVRTATDVASAMAFARERLPDLVVSDVEMPGGTGIELADALSELPGGCRVPVILLTGRGHLVEREAAERMNVRGLLAKPFSARELVNRVRSLLGMSAGGGGEVAA